MSSYLLSSAAVKFEDSPSKDGMKFTLYAPKGWADSPRYMLMMALQACEKMTELFAGPRQPLKAIDIVAVTMKYGAIENSGLITMRGKSCPPVRGWQNDRKYAATALTNEMVRFWLRKLVTMR